jgi:predicted transposase/invertase (TIGR01784 family)
LELLGRDIAEVVNYDFRSVEVKQAAFRVDGVLIPRRSQRQAPVYFSEVQFQKDNELYHRFFAEIHVYLKQYPQTPDWHGILIYPRRSLEPSRKYWHLYRSLLGNGQVTCIYLEDLQHREGLSLGLELIQLVVEPKRRAKTFARHLVQRVQQETGSGVATDRLLEMIETILVYKFGSLMTKELEAMFGLSELKKTRVYQEGFEEGGRDRQSKMLENLLKVRFGQLDKHLAAVIPALLELPDDEALAVLLNSSREEIIDRFTPKA